MAFAVSRKALNVQAKKGGSKTTKVCDKSIKQLRSSSLASSVQEISSCVQGQDGAAPLCHLIFDLCSLCAAATVTKLHD
jgi:hypothetical protein